MTRYIRSSALGLLWLAFGATAFAVELKIKDQNFPVGNGGGFTAVFTADPNNIFELFCVDYLNFINQFETPYEVNVSTLPSIANTRYGTTPAANFQFQTVPVGQPLAGQSLGDAVNRYLLAGWLTTQYDFSAGAGSQPQDLGIQSAIWTLLSVTGAPPDMGDRNVWLNNAVAWEQSQTAAQLLGFGANIRIYTSVLTAGVEPDARYTTGPQEMMNVVPEPAAFLLLGTGLVGIGMIVRRRKKQ